MEEELDLTNHLSDAIEFNVELELDADFLDLFEMKAREFPDPQDQVFAGANRRKVTRGRGDAPQHPLTFAHADGKYSGLVTVETHPPPHLADRLGLSWRLRLKPQHSAKLQLRVRLEIQGRAPHVRWRLRDFGADPAEVTRRFRAQEIVAGNVSTSWTRLQRVYRQSLRDVTALLVHQPHLNISLPVAGMPWFMTVFGRDTLLTAYQLLPGGAGLAWGALSFLASLQATESDPRRDAQPGRILHELRSGPVATNSGAFPYYGTIDAPLLFLILLHEAWIWTGDDVKVRALRPAAEAVLRWMDDFGDLDSDGFIEYQRRSSNGLVNQSWKDSWDSIRFHDGRVAESPIATAEVQGYAYDALCRVAELARGPWADPDLAARLVGRAAALFDHFNEVFWDSRRGGFYHLALDEKKRRVDSKTSNMGQLLWSGIVPADRARAVVSQLMSSSLFSGWGIRTMSTEDRGFNPVSYHCGAVWPHDNSLAVAGLHRYGFHEEANRVMVAVVDAASRFTDSRLPEAFAGYDRSLGPFPVEYPTACIPQAWSSAAPLLMLTAALGIRTDAGKGLVVNPHLPVFVDRLEMKGVLARQLLYEVEVVGGASRVRLMGALDDVSNH
jgi:glycogen debranching enzyme